MIQARPIRSWRAQVRRDAKTIVKLWKERLEATTFYHKITPKPPNVFCVICKEKQAKKKISIALFFLLLMCASASASALT